MEEWRPVEGWEGLYEVSSEGNVRSLGRVIHVLNPWGVLAPRTYKPRQLRPAYSEKVGYPLVSFTYPDRKREYRFVHQLVARAFLGPAPEGHEIRHIDGIKANCRLDNLEYGTRSENALDRHIHGTVLDNRGERSALAKLKNEDIFLIRAEAKRIGFRELGRRLGVSHRTISDVFYGRRWEHLLPYQK